MRIEFVRSGGLAGMSVRLVLEGGDLAAGEREALERLIAGARFFELPPRIVAARPDAFQYDLAIEAGGRRHEVRVSDPAAPPGLKPLLARLTELARERRDAPPTGSPAPRGRRRPRPDSSRSHSSRARRGAPPSR